MLSHFMVKIQYPRLFICFILLFINYIGFSQNGSVKGKITTSDGQPAEFVNVGLLGTAKSALTNNNGEFQINDIQPGKYTLKVSTIGLESKTSELIITANETTVIDFSLNETTQQLKEIVVFAAKSNNERPVNIGKIAIKPIDLPQSTAIIDKDVMEQQQTLKISDALKNFNGVYLMGTSGGYQEEIAGRGFAFGSSNTFKNGIRFNNLAMPEMSALERIEVMKGSSAILFGNVAAGGVINLITKKPDFNKGSH